MSSHAKCEKLGKANIHTFLDSFDNILTDCDGVLWDGPNAIPGSVEAIQLMQALGKKVFYVTNNSTKTRAEYVKKCQLMGYPADLESIIGTAYVAVQHIRETLGYSGKVYLIGSTGLSQELEEAGLQHTGVGPDPCYGQSLEKILYDAANVPLEDDIGCVLVGFDPYFCYTKCLRATSYLQNPDCHFIGTNIDSGLPLGPKRFIPGTGSIVQCVAMAASRTPTLCGKPEQLIFDVVMKKHNLDPSRTIMIGDRLNTDIALAGNCGLHASLMVLTGFNTLQDAQQCMHSKDAEMLKQVPNYYVGKLGDIVDLAKTTKVV